MSGGQPESNRRRGAWRRSWRVLVPGLALALALGGCTGVGVGEAPTRGRAEYQVWGLNEASSKLTGSDRTVVLNGDLDNDSKPLFAAGGEWGTDGFVLDEASATAARELAGRLPERTGDPACTRMVLVSGRLLGDRAVAVLAADSVAATGPVTATPLDIG